MLSIFWTTVVGSTLGGIATTAIIKLIAIYWFRVRVKVYLKFYDENTVFIFLENSGRRPLTQVSFQIGGFLGHAFPGSEQGGGPIRILYSHQSIKTLGSSIQGWKRFWESGELKDFDSLDWQLLAFEGRKQGKISKEKFFAQVFRH